MNLLLIIALGGAFGAVARYLVSAGVYTLLGRAFPYGTLCVNVVGSFVMGFLAIVLVERVLHSQSWRAFLLIGFLGAFTTFSSFSIETLNLVEQGKWSFAGLNIVLSVMACLLAVWLGTVFARQL